MAPLRDAGIIDDIHLALDERSSGGIEWKPLASEWVRKDLDGYTPQAIDELLHDHVAGGKAIDQVPETREGYRRHRYHYDFRICVSGRRLYVETRLQQGKMGPIVTIVNIHDA